MPDEGTKRERERNDGEIKERKRKERERDSAIERGKVRCDNPESV